MAFLPVAATNWVIDEGIRAGFWRFDEEVRRNGPKYKRMVHGASGLVVELFAAEYGNWGLQLALRTGPAEFNVVLVTKPWKGGAMPADVVMRDGWLWRMGRKVETRTEEEFFGVLGVPWWEPEERQVMRLVRWLAEGKGLRERMDGWGLGSET